MSRPRGGCYNEESIIRLFNLDAPESNFGEIQTIFEALKQGDGLKEHLASIYFASGNNEMPWAEWNPTYIPVGVRKWKKAL